MNLPIRRLLNIACQLALFSISPFEGNVVSFENLNLHPAILRAIEESGYTAATPIQAQAIPEVLAGHDLMASAQTGTGKTAAFTLPALNLLATPHPSRSRGPRILVLSPIRCRTSCCHNRWIFW